MLEGYADTEDCKRVLLKNCEYVAEGEKGFSDFIFTDPVEAVLFSMYTDAFFLLDEDLKLKFLEPKPDLEVVHYMASRESESYRSLLPVFQQPLSMYLRNFCVDLLSGPKHLLFVDLSVEHSREVWSKTDYYEKYWRVGKRLKTWKVFKKIDEHGFKPIDLMIYPTVGIGEDFYEYFAGVMLRKKGYLVSKLGLGITYASDMYAYYLPSMQDALSELSINGAFLPELGLLTFNRKRQFGTPRYRTGIAAVIEAEPTPGRTRAGRDARQLKGNGFGQARSHLRASNGAYNMAFAVGPFCTASDAPSDIGLISFDESGNLVFVEREPEILSSDCVSAYETLIKGSVLLNIPWDERLRMLGLEKSFRGCYTYYDSVKSLNILELIQQIKQGVLPV